MQYVFSILKRMVSRVALVLMLVGVLGSLAAPALAADTDYYGTSRTPINQSVDKQGVVSDEGQNQQLGQARDKSQAADYKRESYDEMAEEVANPRGIEKEYEENLKAYRQSQKD